MLTAKDRETLVAASVILKVESKHYYDMYRRHSNGLGSKNVKESRDAYDKYHELDKIARELDIIAFGI
jgi:hypothetical protein